MQQDEFDYFPLCDDLDRLILMHKDAHFGGQFSFMLDYYTKGGKGALDEIPIERIVHLFETEQASGQNLSALLLSGSDAEAIAKSRNKYKQLRDLYDNPSPNELILIADLILSEEEIPEKEIEAIIKEGPRITKALVELLVSEEFLDPLFPGYGRAPELAAIALGKIKDENAIIPLFEMLGKDGFFIEETVLQALKEIGASSKNFLIQQLLSKPITKDHEKAAIALAYFCPDEELAKIGLKELKTLSIEKYPQLAVYLILMCEGLKEKDERQAFQELMSCPRLPQDLLFEMKMIIRSWKS